MTTQQPTETPREYKDSFGIPRSLNWLVKNEPEWAANQIRHRDQLERELTAARAEVQRWKELSDATNEQWQADRDRLVTAKAEIVRLKEAGDCLDRELDRLSCVVCPEDADSIEQVQGIWGIVKK